MGTSRQDGVVLRSERVMLPGGWAAAEVACSAGYIDTIDPPGTHGEVVDLGASALVPGYVDVQMNGGYGHDFSANPETIWKVGARLPITGVTTFLPTIITGPDATAQAALEAVENPPAGYLGSDVLGLHFEGPVLSPENPGAHDPNYLSTVVPLETWLNPRVRIVTLAAELVAPAVIGDLTAHGVVVALGHTNGTFDDANRAFAAGVRHVTHLFNAMPPIHHRAPGPIVAALLNRGVTVGVIPDGVHVHPAVLELVGRTVGPGRFIALTDAIAATGMPPGEYRVGPLTARSDGVSMKLPDGTHAGSLLTMDRAVRYLIHEVGLTPFDAITSASTAPAALVGDDERGLIRPGARADLVVLDAGYQVETTLIGGEIAHGEPR